MSNDSIYLDHSATTRLDDRVAAAMQTAARECWANPASQHHLGRQARRAVESAHERISQLLGAEIGSSEPDQLVLTSGATEANNLAIRGLAGPGPGRVIISAIEHPSVLGPAEYLTSQGFELCRLPVSADGTVDPDALTELLSPETKLVSLMLGNHETGVLQPVARIAQICTEASVPLHTDAAQAAGKVPIDFRAVGVTAMTISAHKMNGPVGSGALCIRRDAQVNPLLFGGFQQHGIRPGTESVCLATGLCAALEIWTTEQQTRSGRISRLRDQFETRLRDAWPDMAAHGSAAERLPHISCISFPGVDRQALAIALDMAGVACSTGTACASGSSEPSPVLEAMAADQGLLDSAVRFSFGADTTRDEIDEAVRRILLVLKRFRDDDGSQNSPESPPLATPESL
jgi:cysteine desulfurase